MHKHNISVQGRKNNSCIVLDGVCELKRAHV